MILTDALSINDLLPYLTKQNCELLSFLTANEKDSRCFMEKFFNGMNKIFFAIEKFRQYRIGQMNWNYSNFYHYYKVDKQGALQQLFQHPVRLQHVALLNRRLLDREVSVRELFLLHKENPNARLLSFLK